MTKTSRANKDSWEGSRVIHLQMRIVGSKAPSLSDLLTLNRVQTPRRLTVVWQLIRCHKKPYTAAYGPDPGARKRFTLTLWAPRRSCLRFLQPAEQCYGGSCLLTLFHIIPCKKSGYVLTYILFRVRLQLIVSYLLVSHIVLWSRWLLGGLVVSFKWMVSIQIPKSLSLESSRTKKKKSFMAVMNRQNAIPNI